MAYIGQQPVVGRYILLDQISGGFNGTTSGFTMSTAAGAQGVVPGLAQNVLLSLGGVIQQPGVDYTISGSGLTFTSPPVSGTTFFATVLGDAQAVGTPSDGTVTPASIASGYNFVFPNLTVTGVHTIASGTASAPSLSITGDSNTGLYSPGADQVAISTNGSGRLFVDSSGRVGVGVSSPRQLLTLGSTTATSTTTPDCIDLGGTFSSANGSNAKIKLFFDGTNTFGFGAAVNSQLEYLVPSSGNHVFFRGTTESARIDSSGRLGLGTSSPGTRLSVADTSPTDGIVAQFDNLTSTAGTQCGIRLRHGSTSALQCDLVTTRDALNAGVDFAIKQSDELGAIQTRFYISETGRVGIGTTSPGGKLEVRGGTSDSNVIRVTDNTNYTFELGRSRDFAGSCGYIGGTGGTALSLGSNDVERIRIDTSGRVGIGTTSVTAGNLLEVRGRIESRNDSTSEYAFYARGGYTSGGEGGIRHAAGLIDLRTAGAYALTFSTNNSEVGRFDTSGRLLVGTSSARSNFYNGSDTTRVQIEGNTGLNSSLALIANANATFFEQPRLILAKAQGSGTGQNGALSNGDVIADISFQGSDGTEFVEGARIRAETDGGVSANDMPTRLVFSTTADSASSPTERMRINSNGQVIINNGAGVTQGTGAGLFVKANTSSSSDYSLHCTNSAATQVILGFRNDGYLRSEAVYAQTFAAAANVFVDANGYFYRATSSARYKRDIVSAGYSLALIDRLRPVTYKSAIKGQDGQLSEEVFGGLIAEEVHAAGFTEFVEYNNNNEPDALRYSHMIAIAIKGLQEAHTRIQDLEAEVAALKGA